MRRILPVLLLILVACGSDSNAAKPVSEPGEKLYAVRGKIVSRDASDNSLNLDHEAIPGFMEAMKMDYEVRGAEIAKLPPDGARVEAKLHVTGDNYWITDVRKVP